MKLNLTKGEWFQIGLAALTIVGTGASTAASIFTSRVGEKTVKDIRMATEAAVTEIQEAYPTISTNS